MYLTTVPYVNNLLGISQKSKNDALCFTGYDIVLRYEPQQQHHDVRLFLSPPFALLPSKILSMGNLGVAVKLS